MNRIILPLFFAFLIFASTGIVQTTFEQSPSVPQQNNTTIQFAQQLKQKMQANTDNPTLSYAVFFITSQDKCPDSGYQSLKFYKIVTDEYLSLYQIPHSLEGALCIPAKQLDQYFSGLSAFALPIVIMDPTVGNQLLVQQGYFGLYEISGTGRQSILVCACDFYTESWTGAWVLSHELSHFALHWYGAPDSISVNWVHYIQALVNSCEQATNAKSCPQYSAIVTAPSGNQIPVMEIFGQNSSSYNIPPNPPQQEASYLTMQNQITNQVNKTTGPRNCQQGIVCVIPGDYLTYYTQSSRGNASVSLDFGSFIDPVNINLKATKTLANGTILMENDALDTKKDLITRMDGSQYNFNFVYSTPINFNENNNVTELTTTFNGFNRDALDLKQQLNQTDFIDLQTDKETGVLLNYKTTHVDIALGKLKTTEFYTLLGSNIINSSDISTVKNQILIPTWIKNNAKWWSSGQIADSEFIKGIQYLIQNGIMKIPQTAAGTSSSSQIPSWIKNNADWWANGQISDDDFVKGIQWLVSNGIIRV